MTADQIKTPHGRYYLLSYPRTASNLLVKILNLDAQSNFASGDYDGGYFFMPVDDMLIQPHMRATCARDWTPEDRSKVRKCYQTCFDDMQAWLAVQSDRGKSAFVKEHTHFLARPEERSKLQFGSPPNSAQPAWIVNYAGGSTVSDLNPTIVPDEFLQTWLPTILIRHPALAFPSFYRTLVKLEGGEAAAADNYASFLVSLRWSRQLYDFYAQHRHLLPCPAEERALWPVVLDAEDVITNSETVLLYSRILKMDPDKLRFSWDETKKNKLSNQDAGQLTMRSTLYESTGVILGKAQSKLNISEEAGKWKNEFGEPAAQYIEKQVLEAMPDYEYLKSRRLLANSS